MKQLPNILFITADQLRKDALGCYGNAAIQTPTIDRLAEQGVRFDQTFAAYPVCAPNRASIVTGRYPSVHRLRSNGRRLPMDELTLMQVLRDQGYRTYGSGKMHFGPQWQFPPDGGAMIDRVSGAARVQRLGRVAQRKLPAACHGALAFPRGAPPDDVDHRPGY